MLAHLSRGEANVSDLAKPFLKDMSLPAITKHLKVLEAAGLITKTKDAQYRSCKLNSEALKDANDWIEEFKAMWEDSLDRLGDYLKELQAPKKSKSTKGKRHGKRK